MWLHRGTELGLVSPRGWNTDDGSTCLETADLSQFRILSVVWDGNFFLIGLPKVKLDVMLKAPGKSLNVRWKLISVGLCNNPVSRLVRCYCAHFTNKKNGEATCFGYLPKDTLWERGQNQTLSPMKSTIPPSCLIPNNTASWHLVQRHQQFSDFTFKTSFCLRRMGIIHPTL